MCGALGHKRTTCKRRSITQNHIPENNKATISVEDVTEPGYVASGFDFAVGDVVLVKYPWLSSDVEVRIKSISQETGNVWLYDINNQCYRGYNFKSAISRGATVRRPDGTKRRLKRKPRPIIEEDNFSDKDNNFDDVLNSMIDGKVL
jgi:hypothetical protein